MAALAETFSAQVLGALREHSLAHPDFPKLAENDVFIFEKYNLISQAIPGKVSRPEN